MASGRHLLREEDAAFLEERGIDFDVATENNMICLILREICLPDGYNHGSADLLLRLPLQFPDAAPDMFWMDPPVLYANGGVPLNTNPEVILGRTWQRWSRHFSTSPWRPGVDNLRSYYRLIKTTLEREVLSRAA